MSTRASILILLAFALQGLATVARAQEADSLAQRTVELDPIVITASKVNATLSSSTVGVSVLDARALNSLPTRSIGHALGLIPGITFLDFDGLGIAPQAVTRGFYGGGEAEYVIVMLNGKPLNSLENGMVNWEQIASTPSTVIEVLRGGASSLYGDAAIGAVINVRTEPTDGTGGRIRASGGTLGVLGLSGSVTGNRFSAAGDFSSSEGFRDHSRRASGTLQGSYQLISKGNDTLRLSSSFNRRDYQTPGPLRSTDPTKSGRESLPFFRFDEAQESTFRASLDGDWGAGPGRLTTSLSGEWREHDMVRTLPLSADFADTQERNVGAQGLRGSVQMSDLTLPIGVRNQLVIGVDAHLGSMDSRYFQVATGGIDDTYLTTSGNRGALASDGSATRLGMAAYAFVDFKPTSTLTLSAGGRLDRIEDSFDEVSGLSDPAPSATHNAFSPKAGLNYRYVADPDQVGNLYLSVSRSFKAPTLDQLYDLRALPVPFPPYAVRISNAGLVPQEGTNLEVGFYHRVSMPSGLAAMLSASAYTIDMKNELDFSFETFTNINIGRSRHRGLETGLTLEQSGLGSAFLNYTLQNVTFLNGANEGNRVKAIPLHAFSGGVMTALGPVSGSLVFRGTGDTYVDDANTATIPDFVTMDARLAYSVKPFRITLDAFNLFDKDYYSTAYPDPAGSEALFLFPAAGRTASLGVEVSF